MNSKICRLCLKTIYESDFDSIEDITKQMLDNLLLKLNLNVSREPLVCKKCVVDLEKSFSYKSACLNAEGKDFFIKYEENVDLSSGDNENKIVKNNSEDHKVCRFCLRQTEIGCCNYLHETKEKIFIADVIEKHIPELNVSITQRVVICSKCLDELHSFSTFIMKCLEAEEKITRYIESSGGVLDPINLYDVQQFILNSPLKYEVNSEDVYLPEMVNCENGTVTIKTEMKNEEFEDVGNLDVSIKNEELEIKPEQGVSESDENSKTADEIRNNVDLSPPRKRLKKNHLSIEIKEMILNIYKQELEENPELIIDEIVGRVANKVGVCRASVFKVYKEYKTFHTFSKPKTNENRTSKINLLDEGDKHTIRKKVHEFFFRNEMPTIDKVLKVVNEEPDLPNFKRSTFYKLLKELKFKWQKRGRNSILIDRDEIVLWRREYLIKIKSYRYQNRKIYFLDETWVNAGHTKSKVWVDKNLTSSRKAFLDELSTGLKNPTGKRKGLLICHIGSVDGFVHDSLWCFESEKTTDYHEEMNGESFEKWFSDTLPRLEDNAVIVLDNASYHSRKLEKIPTTTSKKSDIQNWLRSKSIDFDESMLKLQLLAIVKQHKEKYEKFVIDEMAKNQNKTILRLPPYHCELNPIELIWADVKNFIAKYNTTFKFSNIKELFNDALKNITPEKWQKCIQHVQEKVEAKMWELDNIIEAQIEPLVIKLNDDDSTSSSSE